MARELFLSSRQGLGAGVRARAEAARKLGGVGPAELFSRPKPSALAPSGCGGKQQVRTNQSRALKPMRGQLAPREHPALKPQAPTPAVHRDPLAACAWGTTFRRPRGGAHQFDQPCLTDGILTFEVGIGSAPP